jgi:hypothetical protein
LGIKAELSTALPVQVFLYEPTFPRKHLTLLMIGDWAALVQAKAMMQARVDHLVKERHGSFEGFQRYTYHQQLRFSFKSLKRFVLELDIKYLNHWDMVSLFVEQAASTVSAPSKAADDLEQLSVADLYRSGQPAHEMSLKEELRRAAEDRADLEAFIRYVKDDDVETCVNSLFVLTNSEPEKLEDLMRALRVNKPDLLRMMAAVLKINVDEHKESLRWNHSHNHFYSKPFFYQAGASGGYKYFNRPATDFGSSLALG